MKYVFCSVLFGFVGGWLVCAGSHHCPRPSVEQVQSELNKVIDPVLFEYLVIDGVAGTKTIEAWQFYNTGWEAINERNWK